MFSETILIVIELGGYQTGNAYHFFLECPHYSEQRNALFNCISDICLHQAISIFKFVIIWS